MSIVWEQELVSLTMPSVSIASSDDQLVRACLSGNQQAWGMLIDKYKNFIYAVPVRGGLDPQDAADIFQGVCLELFAELPKLRRVESLRGWLLTVATHKLYHLRRQRRRWTETFEDGEEVAESAPLPESLLEEIEQQQQVRDAVASLPARCQRMVRLLFYEQPPRPYRDVARELGIATGSIGFIRGRCLARLHKALERIGAAKA